MSIVPETCNACYPGTEPYCNDTCVSTSKSDFKMDPTVSSTSRPSNITLRQKILQLCTLPSLLESVKQQRKSLSLIRIASSRLQENASHNKLAQEVKADIPKLVASWGQKRQNSPKRKLQQKAVILTQSNGMGLDATLTNFQIHTFIGEIGDLACSNAELSKMKFAAAFNKV